MSVTVIDPEEMYERLRSVIKDAISVVGLGAQREPDGYLNVESAAAYLDTSKDSIRSAEKRKQLRAHRTTTGRLLFTREQLDTFARGDIA